MRRHLLDIFQNWIGFDTDVQNVTVKRVIQTLHWQLKL